jgi:hypothetical protein
MKCRMHLRQEFLHPLANVLHVSNHRLQSSGLRSRRHNA